MVHWTFETKNKNSNLRMYTMTAADIIVKNATFSLQHVIITRRYFCIFFNLLVFMPMVLEAFSDSELQSFSIWLKSDSEHWRFASGYIDGHITKKCSTLS
jgi:hypothetical protein